MKKNIIDLIVTSKELLSNNYVLLKLTTKDGSLLPEMLPGQFSELRVDNSPNTFLRRPISINFVDTDKNEIWYLVQMIGDGTKKLAFLPLDSPSTYALLCSATLVVPKTFSMSSKDAVV